MIKRIDLKIVDKLAQNNMISAADELLVIPHGRYLFGDNFSDKDFLAKVRAFYSGCMIARNDAMEYKRFLKQNPARTYKTMSIDSCSNLTSLELHLLNEEFNKHFDPIKENDLEFIRLKIDQLKRIK